MRRLLLSVYLILLPVLMFGQIDSVLIREISLPILNKHYFVPNPQFPSPFMTTYFATTIGGGNSLTEIPITIAEENIEGRIRAEDTFISAALNV